MTFIGWKSIGFFLIIFEAKEKVALIMRERERERERKFFRRPALIGPNCTSCTEQSHL